MASICVLSDPPISVDYSIVDGRVLEFILHGVTLYSETDTVALDGWREELVKLVLLLGLDIEHNGHGLHAFVYRLQDDGLIPN